jgi:hypothetical protein
VMLIAPTKPVPAAVLAQLRAEPGIISVTTLSA